MPSPQRPVTTVSVDEVFNLPLTEGFLVLDARLLPHFTEAHLVSAWPCPPAVVDGSEPELHALLARIADDDPPDMLSTVIVCRDPGQNVDGLVQLLARLDPNGAAVEALDRWCLVRRLAERLGTVSVFEDTEAFARQYPFLVVAGDARYPPEQGAVMSVLPALIAPADEKAGRGALYLGAEIHASNEDAFRILGIRAVVNATPNLPCFFDAVGGACPSEASGHVAVEYHRCAILDDESQDLLEAFRTSHAFLETVGCGRGVATLVHCSRGRNRSAALVAHHLVRSKGLLPEEAIAVVRARRPGGTLSNKGFVAQLMAIGTSDERRDDRESHEDGGRERS